MFEPSGFSLAGPKRIDLHCHSNASTEADEALLNLIHCPESYSEPGDIYNQAISRGMNFVTISDHDSIAGVNTILDRPSVLTGEEVTCYFPEDRCKIHVLVWGITAGDHAAMQAVAHDIYRVANYIFENRIAHAVAHPLYVQNGLLDRWHIERLVLMFNGFECLNGAHSERHRAAFEPMLDALDATEIARIEREHSMRSPWPRPWEKVRTAGSDDHGLFNVGRTWTEIPEHVNTVEEVLDCLRAGRCRPGGEAGSSVKLAHNFFGVGMRYFTRGVASPSDLRSAVLQRVLGDRATCGKLALAPAAVGWFVRSKMGSLLQSMGLRRRRRGTDLLGSLSLRSALARISSHSALTAAMRQGQPALAEHGPMFELMSQISRDVSEGIFDEVCDAIGEGEIGAVFDAISTLVAQQAMLMPYYFALFHQNQERHLLSRLTGLARKVDRHNLHVGLFTDNCDIHTPAGRMAADLAKYAEFEGLRLTVHSCRVDPAAVARQAKNFTPLVARNFESAGLELIIPPVLEILEWADRQQFDVIVTTGAGAMAVTGWLVAKMLRVPMLPVLHEDLPAAVLGKTGGDYRVTEAAAAYTRWLAARGSKVLVRSRHGRQVAEHMGVAGEQVTVLPPVPDGDEEGKTAIANRDAIWERLRVRQPRRLVCAADVSSKQDLMLIAEAFAELAKERADVALVLIGKGRWTSATDHVLRRLPVYRMQPDAEQTKSMLESADLLLHCDRNDVCGQWVIDGQVLGLPALVGTAGAGCEFLDDGLTGLVLAQDDASAWTSAMREMLGDEPRRQRMSRTARLRATRMAGQKMQEKMWDTLLEAVAADADDRSLTRAAPAAGASSKRPRTESADTEAVIA
jgi:glycosyltransferase involved in cell wall biosynthesis